MNNKIMCEDGVERLLTEAVKHDGRWISNQQWCEETHYNELPLGEPLKSEITTKILSGQLKSTARGQSNSVYNSK